MKKSMLSIMLIGMLIYSGFGVIAVNNDILIKKDSLVISQPIIREVEDFISVDFNEATSFMNNIGEPMLPIITKVIILPFGSKIIDIEVSYSDPIEMSIKKDVKLVPDHEPIFMSNKIMNIENKIKNMVLYDNYELYPLKDFDYSLGAGLNGEEHVNYLSIHCHPIRYSPTKNIIYFSEKIDIEVKYEKPKSPLSFNDEYDLVIISPNKFSNILKPLINHKNDNNVQTMLKPTEEIVNSYQGRDEAEKIKYFIKDAIENWNAKYVLLIGDMDFLPMRITDINMGDEEGIPTDLYYADIYDENMDFCSWDTDNDNKFGEYDPRGSNNDLVDLFADIKVGRLPCKNSFELKTAINKITTYETKTNGQEWFNRAVLMGGDTFPNHGPYEGEIVTEEISKQLTEFDSIKLWTSLGNYNPKSINQEITKGAGFVSYSGHGYVNGFGTSPPEDTQRIEYYLPYTIGMLNIKKYPVIFFDACSTAEIDYKYYGIKIPCFAWYLIIKPFGGAVATIGSTRVAFTWVDEQGIHGGAGLLNLNFFKAYEPGVTVSQMFVSSQNNYLLANEWRDHVTLEEFNLIGDPSLKIGGYTK